VDQPFLSVIICTLNRRNDLLRTLRYFTDEETYSQFEVIVIDQSDESDPMVQDLLAKNSDRFQAVHRSEKHLAKARNIGIHRAKGEILVFVDDDVRIFPEFLAAHTAALIDAEVWGGTGPVFDPKTHKLVSAESLTHADIDDLNSGRQVIHTDFAYDICTLAGGNMSIRRSAFEKIGDFDEFYENYGDDVEISHRLKLAGGRLRYTPNAQLVHYGRQTGGVREMSNTQYTRNYVRSVLFFDRQFGLRQIKVLRMFRRMIVSRQAYRNGRMALNHVIAFWQGVAEASIEFNRRRRKNSGIPRP
jgi:GT2 family glycosyltransferase